MPNPQDHDKKQQADDQLIVRYFDGQLDEQAFAELNERMKQDAYFRQRFIELSLQAHHLQALVGKPDLALVQDELLHAQPGQAPLKLVVLMRYRVGIGLAAAAVLVFALTLVFVFSGGGTGEQSSEFAQTAEISAAPVKQVATLTAERDAVWSEDALAPGSQLRAGQRFTLTQGFAEITTLRGAVAMLQAPATIELFDNDNALQLHSGKLVGICETESSKGFVVRTPHMDVTDLGTRFGVAVDEAGQVMTRVFEGSIRVTPPASNPGAFLSRELTAGQAVSVDRLGTSLETAQAGEQVFSSLTSRLAGVASLSGDVDWADASSFLGVAEADWPTGNRAVLFEEARGHTLKAKLPINASATPPYRTTDELELGTSIRSYIVLLYPGGVPSSPQGEIVFEQEVLGVVTGLNWGRASEALRAGGVSHPFEATNPTTTGLEIDRDAVEILPDRRTVRFAMKANQAGDAVRIIIREPGGGPTQP